MGTERPSEKRHLPLQLPETIRLSRGTSAGVNSRKNSPSMAMLRRAQLLLHCGDVKPPTRLPPSVQQPQRPTLQSVRLVRATPSRAAERYCTQLITLSSGFGFGLVLVRSKRVMLLWIVALLGFGAQGLPFPVPPARYSIELELDVPQWALVGLSGVAKQPVKVRRPGVAPFVLVVLGSVNWPERMSTGLV